MVLKTISLGTGVLLYKEPVMEGVSAKKKNSISIFMHTKVALASVFLVIIYWEENIFLFVIHYHNDVFRDASC
jgi:hypothetical protein